MTPEQQAAAAAAAAGAGSSVVSTASKVGMGSTGVNKKKKSRKKKPASGGSNSSSATSGGNNNRSGSGGNGTSGAGTSGGNSSSLSSPVITAATAAKIRDEAARAHRQMADWSAASKDVADDAAWATSPDPASSASAAAAAAASASIVLPSSAPNLSNNNGSNSNAFLDSDVRIVQQALRANGLTMANVTPSAFASLLEYARRYALELAVDAQEYAYHADRHEIEPSDLLLAYEMKEDQHHQSYPTPTTHTNASTIFPSTTAGTLLSALPPMDQLMDLADQVNRIPLPPISSKSYNGILLPPPQHQLTARTFDVVTSTRHARNNPSITQHQQHQLHSSTTTTTTLNNASNGSTKSKPPASYGANRGRQILFNLKTSPAAATTMTTAPPVQPPPPSAPAAAAGVIPLENLTAPNLPPPFIPGPPSIQTMDPSSMLPTTPGA